MSDSIDSDLAAIDLISAIWKILDETGSETWVRELVNNGIISWRLLNKE